MATVIQIGSQQSFGAAGSYFGSETALQLGASANFVLTRGLWMVATSANDTVQYSPDAGVTWRTVIPSSDGGLIFSDGFNVRILNGGVADAGAVKTYYSQIKAVPGV